MRPGYSGGYLPLQRDNHIRRGVHGWLPIIIRKRQASLTQQVRASDNSLLAAVVDRTDDGPFIERHRSLHVVPSNRAEK